MTDLEITKLCAEAMELPILETFENWNPPVAGIDCERKGKTPFRYDPLHDDAQAMALVKKFKLHIYFSHVACEQWWQVIKFDNYVANTDLNRAICECVAKMQAAKNEADRRFGQPHYGHARE